MRVSASFQFGRSLYIDGGGAWCGGRGNVLHYVKREGELSGRRNAQGIMSEGEISYPSLVE